MNLREFRVNLALSSVPLRKLNDTNIPIGFASGCLLRYKEKLFLLSVAHATRTGRWALELSIDNSGEGTRLYQFGTVNLLASGNLFSGRFQEVDFSYVEIHDQLVGDLAPYLLLPDENDPSVIMHIPRSELKSDLSTIPNFDNTFGFCGLVRNFEKNGILRADIRLETDLKYIGNFDDMYMFRLNTEYNDSDDYRGCSGAPILDQDGGLISLIVSGLKEKNAILGIALRHYKSVLDIITHP